MGTKSLLIIGAGGYGAVVKEIAEENNYERIAFLDDMASGTGIIGRLEDLKNCRSEFNEAFISIGRNDIRARIFQMARTLGYTVPVLCASSAFVSRSAVIGDGTLIGQHAVINPNCIIGTGCIISICAAIDHDARIGDFCHINTGVVCMAGSLVEAFRKVECGRVVERYKISTVDESGIWNVDRALSSGCTERTEGGRCL